MITYTSYIYNCLSQVGFDISKLQGKICEKFRKQSSGWVLYKHPTQIKSQLKALIFEIWEKNILIYYQI